MTEHVESGMLFGRCLVASPFTNKRLQITKNDLSEVSKCHALKRLSASRISCLPYLDCECITAGDFSE